MADIYDGVINKPELNEDLLMHYGIKGMKWRKKLKGMYNTIKNKIVSFNTEDSGKENTKRSNRPRSRKKTVIPGSAKVYKRR